MNTIEILKKENAPIQSKQLLDSIEQKLGKIPNIYAAAANSPTTLKAFFAFKDGLSQGTLSPKASEAISLSVAQENNCEYCLSAHSAIAKMNGFSDEQILNLRKAQIEDTKLDALTKLAKEIIKTKGNPSEEAINYFYDEGYSKQELVELIGHIAANIFTNYFNHIAHTPIDFPKVVDIR